MVGIGWYASDTMGWYWLVFQRYNWSVLVGIPAILLVGIDWCSSDTMVDICGRAWLRSLPPKAEIQWLTKRGTRRVPQS